MNLPFAVPMLWRVVACVAVAGAIAAAVGAWGYQRGVDAQAEACQKRIDAKATAISGLRTERDSAWDAVADVQSQLDAARSGYRRAMQAATAALAARDGRIARLKQQAAARAADIEEASRHDPNCSALADLPVCHRIARRLWPAPVQTGGAH